jgi:hypothetical protein
MAQDLHAHAKVSGMPQGIPILCGAPTVTSTVSGAWSDAGTWSTHRVPGANDRVAIPAGHHITYDSLVIENSHFRNQIGVSVATPYSATSTADVVKSAVVRSSMFEPLDLKGAGAWPSETISMNDDMTPRDPHPRDPLRVRLQQTAWQ